MIYRIIKASKVFKGDDGEPVRHLTLGDVNDLSDNRYHVSIRGINANLIDWEKVSRVAVGLYCKSYFEDDTWHGTFGSGNMCELKEVEISID